MAVKLTKEQKQRQTIADTLVQIQNARENFENLVGKYDQWIDEAADASFILQTDLFDALVPNLLSLLAVLMFLRFLKKGIKAQTLIWLTMAASIVLSLLGILGTPPTIG